MLLHAHGSQKSWIYGRVLRVAWLWSFAGAVFPVPTWYNWCLAGLVQGHGGGAGWVTRLFAGCTMVWWFAVCMARTVWCMSLQVPCERRGSVAMAVQGQGAEYLDGMVERCVGLSLFEHREW